MTDTPTGPTAGGSPFGEGFDLNAMMEQAQQMQNQLLAAQEELAQRSVTGTAGGVTVTLNGTGEMTACDLGPGPADTAGGGTAEAMTDLGDLVIAAYRDAKQQADALAQQTLGPLAGGPGGPGV